VGDGLCRTSVGCEPLATMDERLTHHIAVFESGVEFSAELRTALQRRDGCSRFVVTAGTCPQELDPRECELLIIDVDGQVRESLELLAECREFYPCLPAVVLVTRGDTSTAVAAMKAGAVDCLEKPLEAERVWSAVTAVLGDREPSWQHAYRALTRAEVRVLNLVLAGRTNHEIACQLHRSRRTIETHRRNLMRKLGVVGLANLVRHAISAGFCRFEGDDRETQGGAATRQKQRFLEWYPISAA